MEVHERKVEYYLTPNGHAPFIDWLENLKDREGVRLIKARLARIRAGNFGEMRPLGYGVHEMKISWGPGHRIYFGMGKESVVVLLCGGDKRSQTRDILSAQEYWTDYWRRI